MTLEDIMDQGDTKAVSKADGFLAVMTVSIYCVTRNGSEVIQSDKTPISIITES